MDRADEARKQVDWSQTRFDQIRSQLIPFLTQSGFHPTKVTYIPVGATTGENLVERTNEILTSWYEGLTLVEQLGESSLFMTWSDWS